jgi:hypothetical protein
MANELKVAKDLGWDHITLSQKGFKGAVNAFQAEGGKKVALCFNHHEAFIVSDDQGLFGVEDLTQGVVKGKGVDIEATGQIDGAEVVAWEEEENGEYAGVVLFDEVKLTELGINDFSIKESIKARILALSALDKQIDMQL